MPRRIILKYHTKWKSSDPNLRAFVIGVFLLGINGGILSTSFNNYLQDTFHLSETARGALEFPRELPGFLLIALTSLLMAFSMRVWSIAVGCISAAGVLGLAFLSPITAYMTGFMILWSLADHLFMPVESTMGLQLAHEGRQGRRLGQLAGMRNFAMIFGAAIVWLADKTLPIESMYKVIFSIAAFAALAASVALSRVHIADDRKIEKKRFVFRKKYGIFYILNILFGGRKQLFLTFGPWVLITVYNTRPGTIAILIVLASVLGVLFRQIFGIVTDKLGEKVMFIADAFILFGICMGFALSKNVYILYGLLILDNLMFSTRIARTTYLSKIAEHKSDIPATLSLGISMDHIVSMTIPALGGLVWAAFGYEYVFYAASLIAVGGLITALFIKLKR